jgi:hypothetical protein
MRTRARWLAAALFVAAASAHPQKPAFSGRWVVVSPAEGAGQEQIVTQDEKTITIEHPSEGGGHKLVYQLDGIERRMALPGRASEVVIMAKAAWDGDRIVIASRTTYPNGMKTEAREVWSIDPQGRLVIDFTESGPTGPGPTAKVIHARKK